MWKMVNRDKNPSFLIPSQGLLLSPLYILKVTKIKQILEGKKKIM